MTARELTEQAERLRTGEEMPRRVVVNEDGYAAPPGEALEVHGITPAVVYIRNDGWTLGAPAALADVAWNLWADSWARLVILPTQHHVRASLN